MHLLCFDLGGTELKYGIVDETLSIRNYGCIPSPLSAKQELYDAILKVYQENRDKVEGIAISMPGIIDSSKGIHISGGASVHTAGENVAGDLQKLCGCPVHIENDGKAAAMAEMNHGSLQGIRNGAVFVIGTGIGGGLIMDGKLRRGPHFSAGEFSYLTIYPDKWESLEGNICNHCATPGLLDSYHELGGSKEVKYGRTFFQYLKKEDQFAITAFDRFCRNLAIQIYNISVILDLQRISIGGGISRQPILLKTLLEKCKELKKTSGLHEYDMEPVFPEIVTCHFHGDANLIGAYDSFILDL